MNSKNFLQAFEGRGARVPVWFMRQAGRYLPQYQDLKKKRKLKDLFQTPELAAQITLQPVEFLGVDAAILFADILTLPAQMGFDIDFIDGKGPVVENPITGPQDVFHMHDFNNLDHVKETVMLTRHDLPPEVALIGFAGSPWTVFSYLLKDHNALGFNKAIRFAVEHEKEFHAAMRKLTKNTIGYLLLQKEAGIDAFQVFDTWGGILREADYKRWVLPYVQEIFSAVALPSIYYLKNCAHLLSEMEESRAQFLSVCETVEISNSTILNKTKKGVQGNFYNGLLYAKDDVIKKEVVKILRAAKKRHKKYIFNLNHGVLPDVDPQKLKLIVKTVHAFKWN